MACLDTTVLIDLLGRAGAASRRRAEAAIQELVAAGEDLSTTRFNMAELMVGVYRDDNPLAAFSHVERLLDRLIILDFSERTAPVFGWIKAGLQKDGRPVGDMDLLIASVALVHRESLVTANVRHFTQIPGLRVIAH